ncbi:hypothetical protein [Spirosoma foliorum]|uniref:Uncharacterized protein n=1 Tax=Spirosoma foliorum TaxID=2710596 RepID=A0A7G5GWJ5_9BACT|nr:hypothetical protein [Spirosoma foliorum]QMW03237.1 hypothetical protein H3H32_36115 [Spirosoma foliorum]
MLSVREAAKNALNFYKDIYPNISGELVEEVELDESHKYWLITLSFPVGVDSVSPLSAVLLPKTVRKYKLFKVDAQNGNVESMKIRTLTNDVE